MSSESTPRQHCLKEAPVTSPLINDTGYLVPLKTTLETEARDTVISVYVTAVPLKHASVTLNLARSLLSNDSGVDLQHLRRCVKFQDLPESVRNSISVSRTSPLSLPLDTEATKELFLIVCSTNVISHEDLNHALSSIYDPVFICSVDVPRLAPASQEQAALWTSRYWPTVYKKSNPFGPHPSIVSRAGDEIAGDVQRWMDLAGEVAGQSHAAGFGEAIGVVVVERRDGVARPVAIAGDARWLDWPRAGSGNVTAHAVLRAIGMVAEGLRKQNDDDDDAEKDSTSSPAATATSTTNTSSLDKVEIFQDHPLSALELEYCHPSGEGYLCHDLEIYCTHEPCVMCSMAIVHSRFSRLVFQHRMPSTGGMCADGDLGHGLFWRKELNWTLLAWQWVSTREENSGAVGRYVNTDFNA